AALRGGTQRDISAGAAQRQADTEKIAIGFDTTEGLILLDDARRQVDRAECARLDRKAELVAVHVVTGRDLPAQLDSLRVYGPGREAESLFGIEQLLRVQRQRCKAQGQEQQAQQLQHIHSGVDSCTTQSR